MAPEKKKTILFFHPDLGIGGAERLVIDAAVGLQNRGHKVVIFTSYCDPKHCFDEARNGMLNFYILYSSSNMNRHTRCPSPRKLASTILHILTIFHHMRHLAPASPHTLGILHPRAYPPRTRCLCRGPTKRWSAMARIPISSNTNTVLLPFPRSSAGARSFCLVEATV